MINYKTINNKNLKELNSLLLKDMFNIRKANNISFNNKVENFEKYKFEISRLLKLKDPHIFLIFNNKKLVGYSTGVVKDSIFYRYTTVIHPKYQNQKLGTKLIARFLAYLKNEKKINVFKTSISSKNKIKYINENLVARKNSTKNKYYLSNNSKTISVNKKPVSKINILKKRKQRRLRF